MTSTQTSESNASPANIHRQNARIVIIGGGSPYCAGLMKSFAHEAQAFRGCHIVLMDINEEGLKLIHTIGSKLLKHAGADITLEYTTDMKAAVAGADFVLTTFRTGGMQARRLDEKVPLEHGLIGQETVGAGGFFYALRTVPEVAQIAAEMEKTAPGGFLLNYTNPSNIVTEAVTHCCGVRVIGLCDGPLHEIQQFAQWAGIQIPPGKRLHHRTVGLNHGNWTTAVWLDGEDVLPRIVEYCENFVNDHPEMTPSNYVRVMLATLTACYGAIPSHYMHYYYFPEVVLKFLREKPTSRAEDILAQVPAILEHYRAEAQKEVPNLTKMRGGSGFGDFALDVMRSILHDTGEEWVLNVPNNGSINFLPGDRVVELPCRVDARGAQPLAQGDGGINVDQRGLICMLAEFEGAAATAALWGSRRNAIRALAANPLVASYSKAEEVYEALATAEAQYLPERLLK